jgi:YggT family protein
MIAIFYFLVMTFLKFYWWIVIANVIISWLIAFNVLNTNNVFVYNVLDFTYRLTDPILRKIRGFLPNLGAFDVSPIILLVLIEALKIFMFKYIYPYT